ncbi:protein of unknown function DUF243 [Trinorchestia longiramus]|nr:protein of unknown function DUF243 [Trinorchestia longiramus]
MADYIIKIVALSTLVSAGYVPPVKNTYGLPVKPQFGRSISPHTFGSPGHEFSSAGIGGLVSADTEGFGGFGGFEGFEGLGHGHAASSGFGGVDGFKFGPCPKGLEITIHGKCVVPAVSQDLFLFKAPSYKVHNKKAFFNHKPKVHFNLVFIRAPTYENHQTKPIVVPPPKQQTLVYLLSKKPHGFKQDVIEVPLDPAKPEVFFVDYKDGDNPVLPGGIDLKTALSQAAGPSDIIVGSEQGIGGGLIDGASLGGFSFGGLGKGVGGDEIAGVGLGGFGKGVSHDFETSSFQGGFGGGSINAGFGGGSFKGGFEEGAFAGGIGAGSFKEGIGAGSFKGGIGAGSFKGGIGAGSFKGGIGAGSFQGGIGAGSFKGGIGAGSFQGGIGAGSFKGDIGAGSFKGGFGGGAAGGGLGKGSLVPEAVAPAVGGGFASGITALALKAAEAAGPPAGGFVGGVGGISGAGKEIEGNIFQSVAAGHDPFGDHEEIIIDHGIKGLKPGGVSFGDGKGSPISPFGGFGGTFKGGFGGERSVRSESRPRDSGTKGNIVSGSPMKGF